VAISYKSRVVDNTGKNYIVKDRDTGIVYKVDRNLYDSGKTTIEHGFDLRKDIEKPVKHPDAHIPASEWYKWKEWHKPD